MNAKPSFFERLQRETANERASLVTAPIIERALRGEASLSSYRAFLHEAFHHVRHTVPLLRACRARLPERLSWMYPALDEYIAEEQGHDQWILEDVAVCGGDPSIVRNGIPGAATELMVAYAYDTIARGNPVAFFGMKGFKVIIPVDGISADNAYAEQYTAWHLANVPVIGSAMTLTTLDRVKF